MRFQAFQRRNQPSTDEETLLDNGISSPEPRNSFRRFFLSLQRQPHAYRRILRFTLLLLSVVLVLYLIGYLIWYLVWANHASDLHFLGLKQCPACLGQSACPFFLRSEVHYDGVFRYPLTHKYNPKNVFTAKLGYLRNTHVYVKKLATDESLQSLDKSLCNDAEMVGTASRCVPRVAIYHQLSLKPNSKLELRDISQLSQLTQCPTQRLMDRIMTRFRERAAPDGGIEHYTRFDELVLLFNLNLNPHGVLIQTFSADDGWPFPRYLGSCGRWMLEKYAGEPLHTFWDAPLKIRLELARRLLLLAQHLADNDAGYSMHLDTVDGREFVVDPTNHEVTLVDTRYLLVVDTAELRGMQFQGAETPLVMPSYCTHPPPDTLHAAPLPDQGADSAALQVERPPPCTSNTQALLTQDRGSATFFCSHTAADFNLFAMCRFLYVALKVDANVQVLRNHTEVERREMVACQFHRGWLRDVPQDLEERFNVRRLLCECFLGHFQVVDGQSESATTYRYRAKRVKQLLDVLPQVASTVSERGL